MDLLIQLWNICLELKFDVKRLILCKLVAVVEARWLYL